ncbi:MAG: FixH family protein, partial [Chthoniobacteraceae bacterium]
TSAAVEKWPATRKTDGGNFTVTIQPSGGGITRNRHFSLGVLVEPGAGAAAPASVSVDADMPSHGHGMNTKPETVHEESQRYRADGMLFHMAGEWSIMVEISAGAAQERAFFPVSIE